MIISSLRRAIFGLLVAALAAGVASIPAFGGTTTSPGKKSVFAGDNVQMNAANGHLYATIAKGPKNSVLVLHGTAEMNADCRIGLDATVNNYAMNFGTVYIQGCPVSPCSTSGTFWLDLDAAEAMDPGHFLGKPLQINLQVNNLYSTCPNPTTVTLSLSALVTKK